MTALQTQNLIEPAKSKINVRLKSAVKQPHNVMDLGIFQVQGLSHHRVKNPNAPAVGFEALNVIGEESLEELCPQSAAPEIRTPP
jgi:hypothetical protein